MGINAADKEAYFREEARALKKRVSVPVILEGGLRSLEVAERLIEEGCSGSHIHVPSVHPGAWARQPMEIR
jgi:phosphoribosylformimino-5-aminoimidazole carboxamide ribonucleotide (ProFAR) isomerase